MKRNSSSKMQSGFACSRCGSLVAVVDGSQTEHHDFRTEPAAKCTAAPHEWKQLDEFAAPRPRSSSPRSKATTTASSHEVKTPAAPPRISPELAAQIAALPTPPMLGPKPAVEVFRSQLDRYGAAAVVHSMLTALREWQAAAPAARAMEIGERPRIAALGRIGG
jgi:hypothetical protein